MPARLKEKYMQETIGALTEEFSYANVMQVPKLEKIVINMGVGDAIADPRALEAAVTELTAIAGQKPSIRKSRRAISNFKLREGVNIGCMVTLRGDRMYEFLDRLVNVAIPRVRDFRGVSATGFDSFGNYTLGLREQTIFPEINIDQVSTTRGMNVTFVIRNSTTADESRSLLRNLGMPFTNN